MARRILFVALLFGAAVTFALLFTSEAQASDCTVEAFSVSPNSSSQAVGTILSLYGRGNCAGGIRASRFNIDGGGFGEDAGAPEQSETWQLTTGSHTICFEIAGGSNGDWSAGASSCTTITGVGNNPGGGNASVNGPNIVPDGNCRWYIWFALSGFAPNSTITVTSNYSETVCSTGEVVNSGWTGNTGPTDSNGYLAYAVYHHGTGNYNYTFSDLQGHSVPVSFSTGNTTPPPVNPTLVAPPTTGGNNPTTGNTNPTSGNTSPNNPTGGNTNVVPPSDPYAGLPYLGSALQPSGQWVQVVAPQGISVRNDHSIDAPRIGRANNGVYFRYVETVEGWHHVEWDGGDGWVSAGSQYTQQGSSATQNPSTTSSPSSSSNSNSGFVNHGNGWCSATPREVGFFGISTEGHNYPNPRHEMYFGPDVNLNGPPEYYLYYQGQYVGWSAILGDYIASWTGWDAERNGWKFGINTRWVAWKSVAGENWFEKDRWRLDYKCQ